jgi:hypothetical protein
MKLTKRDYKNISKLVKAKLEKVGEEENILFFIEEIGIYGSVLKKDSPNDLDIFVYITEVEDGTGEILDEEELANYLHKATHNKPPKYKGLVLDIAVKTYPNIDKQLIISSRGAIMDLKIEVKPGVLEMPVSGLTKLTKNHIENLIDKKGIRKVKRALIKLGAYDKAASLEAMKWIESYQSKPSNMIFKEIEKTCNVKAGVNPKDFFSNYSQVAGKIKKIKKMKGDKRKQADKALQTAIDAIIKLKESIGN